MSELPRAGLTARARRGARVIRVGLRDLAPLGVRFLIRRPPPTTAVARQLRLAISSLGGVYVKFGQLLGSAPSIFGPEIAAEFRGFLDEGPPVPFAEVVATLEREWRRPLRDVLTRIDPRPVGCASLAVVHRATLATGEDVAIKILRPGIEAQVAVDMGLLQPLAALIARRFGVGEAEPAVRLFDGLVQQLAEEVDLVREAQAMVRARARLEARPHGRVAIPQVYPDLTTRRVLVAEYVEGIAVDDTALLEWNVEPAALMTDLLTWWFGCALNDQFHADLHAGNLLVTRDGRIYVLDWGIVARLNETSEPFFRQLLDALLGNDDAWDRALVPLVATWDNPPGMSDAEVAEMLRAMLTAVFTRPFGEVDLTALVIIPDRKAGAPANKRDDVAEWMAGEGTEFERHVTMLVKQLLYFERYGKLYLPDKSLLDDREYFEALVAAREPTR